MERVEEEQQLLSKTGQERWQWMVLVSCFFSKVCIEGIRKSFGVLLPVLQREFNTEVWFLGSIVSVFCAVGDLIGPMVGGLARRFSCRVLVMIGGALMCLGMVLASQMTDVWRMALCLFLFCGTGLGFIGDPPFAILGQYFDSNYVLANGFASLGSSAALIIFGPLTKILETTYGWRGAVLILGSIFFHATSCGALLKPSPRNRGSDDQGHSSSDESSNEDNTDTWKCSLSRCRAFIYESFNFSLFTQPLFYVIIVVSCTVRFTHTAWVIYIVPRAVDAGIPPLSAVLVATVGGVGDAVGKIIPGFLKWKQVTSTTVIWTCGMSIMTFSLILSVMTHTFTGMSVFAFFQGLGLGISLSLFNVVYKELFGIDRLVNVMGWLRCFTAVGRVLGGFVPGWIFETSGSYNRAFLTIGCVQGFGVIVLILSSIIIKKTEEYKRQKGRI